MKYNIDIFNNFLKDLINYENEYRNIIQNTNNQLANTDQMFNDSVSSLISRMHSNSDINMSNRENSTQEYRKSLDLIDQEENKDTQDLIADLFHQRLRQNEIMDIYGDYLANNPGAEYDETNIPQIPPGQIQKNIEDLRIKVNNYLPVPLEKSKKKNKKNNDTDTQINSLYLGIANAVKQKISDLEDDLVSTVETVNIKRDDSWNDHMAEVKTIDGINSSLNKAFGEIYLKNLSEIQEEKEKQIAEINNQKERDLKRLKQNFLRKYPQEVFEEELLRINKEEPDLASFECYSENPSEVTVGNMYFPFDDLSLGKPAEDLLNQEYFFLTRYQNQNGKRNEIVKAPFSLTFDEKFNYLFQITPENRDTVIDDICSIVLKLFMMIPPNKVNLTFFDPIRLGETFALFTRLVDVNDQTNKVINGKIWTSEEDLEDKLRLLTEHIANVTQRCLQGKFENIMEYNEVAGKNAEPYQVLVIMDFPTAFNETTLRYLEQIISTGPKCGVFTIIASDKSQEEKLQDKEKSIIKDIYQHLTVITPKDNELEIQDEEINGKLTRVQVPSLMSPEILENILPVLKDGIKSSERIIIEFENLLQDQSEWFKGDSKDGLSIPIGVHGANNIQELTFGFGGAFHALIAGQIGSGKSSLLHTIIMSSLIKYAPDQLQIFLIDFKRGVEFKIYANHQLENFRVVAIESEREFGASVLDYLDREQARRAELFRKNNVDDIESYREKTGKTLPRIMLIVDEFHVLFSKDEKDRLNTRSAMNLEQLIRQGRAFGIHVILASQSMTNIGGISQGTWGQIGVRIALKCPKSDADFVLGPDNSGVDLLAADNPGQAVYNSDGGKEVANTVFRVGYLEQEEQDEYLRYIEKHEPKFNLPETRVMLSNIEDNIYHPIMKFKEGQKVDFSNNQLLLGEDLRLDSRMRINFRKRNASNLLLIGNEDEKARTMFIFSVLSAALHVLEKNNYKKPAKPPIYLFDYAPEEDFFEKDLLKELAKALPDFVKYADFEEAEDLLTELYSEFEQRQNDQIPQDDAYFMLFGLQRARGLRSDNIYQTNANNNYHAFDDFESEFSGVDVVNKNLKPHEMFMNLLQSDAEVGINTLIWIDNFKIFMNNYANMLPNFDMRIAFNMPDDDSISFIEYTDGSKIGENEAIFNYNGNNKFRPYKKPDEQWLLELAKMIQNYSGDE